MLKTAWTRRKPISFSKVCPLALGFRGVCDTITPETEGFAGSKSVDPKLSRIEPALSTKLKLEMLLVASKIREAIGVDLGIFSDDLVLPNIQGPFPWILVAIQGC